MAWVSAKGVVVVIIIIASLLGNPMMFIITVVIFFNRIGLVLVSVWDLAHESDSDTANQSACQYCSFLQWSLTMHLLPLYCYH